MTQAYCPNCNARITSAKFNTDFIHNCSDLDSEITTNQVDDVVVIGQIVDSDGTFNSPGPRAVMNQGGQYDREGERSWVEGDHSTVTFTPRGNKVATTTPRTHYEFIEMKQSD